MHGLTGRRVKRRVQGHAHLSMLQRIQQAVAITLSLRIAVLRAVDAMLQPAICSLPDCQILALRQSSRISRAASFIWGSHIDIWMKACRF